MPLSALKCAPTAYEGFSDSTYQELKTESLESIIRECLDFILYTFSAKFRLRTRFWLTETTLYVNGGNDKRGTSFDILNENKTTTLYQT